MKQLENNDFDNQNKIIFGQLWLIVYELFIRYFIRYLKGTGCLDYV